MKGNKMNEYSFNLNGKINAKTFDAASKRLEKLKELLLKKKLDWEDIELKLVGGNTKTSDPKTKRSRRKK